MLLENLSPVLSAVQRMSLYDNPVPPIVTTTATTSSVLKITNEQYESPSTSTAMTSAANAPASVTLVKNSSSNKRVVDFSGDLPGKIDFLDLWAEEASSTAKSGSGNHDRDEAMGRGSKHAQAPSHGQSGQRLPQEQGQGHGQWVWRGNDYVWETPSSSSSSSSTATTLLATGVYHPHHGAASDVVMENGTSAAASLSRAVTTGSLYKTSFKQTTASFTASMFQHTASSPPASSPAPSQISASSTAARAWLTQSEDSPVPSQTVEGLPPTPRRAMRRFAQQEDSQDQDEESADKAAGDSSSTNSVITATSSGQLAAPARGTDKAMARAMSLSAADAKLASRPKPTAKIRDSKSVKSTQAAISLPIGSQALVEASQPSSQPSSESNGWRAKRKTFGAVIVPAMKSTFDWSE